MGKTFFNGFAVIFFTVILFCQVVCGTTAASRACFMAFIVYHEMQTAYGQKLNTRATLLIEKVSLRYYVYFTCFLEGFF